MNLRTSELKEIAEREARVEAARVKFEKNKKNYMNAQIAFNVRQYMGTQTNANRAMNASMMRSYSNRNPIARNMMLKTTQNPLPN